MEMQQTKKQRGRRDYLHKNKLAGVLLLVCASDGQTHG